MPSLSSRTVVSLAVFLSGAGSLMYQTVWVRMLTRLLGATTYATATVLVVFMSGLALGSWLAGRLSQRVKAPLRAYAALEILIGATGLLASFAAIHGLGGWYVEVCRAFAERGDLALLARVLFVAACLLPPTVLMGATMPLLMTHLHRRGAALQPLLASLYSVNTFGAVAGVLATGFVMLGALGETATLGVAAAFNVASAFAAWRSSRMPEPAVAAVAAPAPAAAAAEAYPRAVRRLGLAAFFVSGMTALAYEVLWTRLLTPFLFTSIYAFSAMLAAFLLGVARGSRAAVRNAWTHRTPAAAFGMLEVLIAAFAIVGLVSLPLFDRLGAAFGDYAWLAGALACLVVVVPPAYCFGLQFPVAVRVCAANPGDAGGAIGWAYAVNTLGAIVGSLAAGFLLIPVLGTAGTVALLAAANLALGLLLLFAAEEARAQRRGAVVLAAALGATLPFLGDPYRHVMATRIHATWGADAQIYEYAERTCATTIAAGALSPFQRTLLVNGVGMTLLCSETKLMAHLPALLAEQPKKMLIVCFGMGTTFRSACRRPELEVDVVDIVPDVFRCFEHFHKDAAEHRRRPGARMVVNDGRNHLLMSDQQYDVITIDPAPPVHSAGTVNLYTKEFFALCKARLTPGGVFCLWLPPDAARADICMVMKSYQSVFPEATLWGGLRFPGFYLIGGHRPLPVSGPQRAELFAKLAKIPDLGEWDLDYVDAKRLQDTFLMGPAGLRQLVADSPEVTDDRPYTEFPLWRWAFGPRLAKPLFDADDLRAEARRVAAHR